jgi:ATP-dependent protease ClpP protease subunit
MQPAIPQTIQPGPIPDTVYVVFSAEINVSTSESLMATLANLVNKGVQTVYLAISTPGGQVPAGLTLYNVLRALPIRLVTHNTGNVDSIGNAVFLAGSTRYACPYATFMFHGVGFDLVNQTVRLEEKMLRERLADILTNHGRIGAIIEERTRIKKADIRKLFREAQTKDAAFAASSGIIDEIRDFQIPPGGPVISLVFQR